MNTFNKIAVPAGEKFRQIQKLVHDIKKNDGGLMQKLKRFTNKNPPSVPQRDYVPDHIEEEEFEDESDEFASDYEDPDADPETYAVPEDGSDYEPPPTEHEKPFLPSFHFSPESGGYADKPGNRQLPQLPNSKVNMAIRQLPVPNQPVLKPSQLLSKPRLPTPPKPTGNSPFPIPPSPRAQVKPQPPPPIKKPLTPPKQHFDDEEDYIVPRDEDDNYIEPTQEMPQAYKPPVVNRKTKPNHTPPKPQRHQSADASEPVLYEVPENEAKPSPPLKRDSLPFQRNLPPKIEPPAEDEYETGDDHPQHRPETAKLPSPLPRSGKPTPPKPQKPLLPTRDVNSNIGKYTERHRETSVGSEFPVPPKLPVPNPMPKPNIMQRPADIPSRFMVPPNRSLPSIGEQEAGVVNKEWYASLCDRKTAEDALYGSSMDGSFLVRKSSGQDPKQPYTLVVFYNRKVYNIPVRFIESTRQYALGREKSGEERFGSVSEMVENHQRAPLVLIDSQNNTKDSTKLKHAIHVR
ncbi:B-cell linker protein-like [Spea bombifrons]|uniref:B-cell linker protein-like n=1 Tax=Spea bombifrons TaxID=233779 RepID=UPI00234A0D92|nr:B-cell linker protein-like [Spea bombifrons]